MNLVILVILLHQQNIRKYSCNMGNIFRDAHALQRGNLIGQNSVYISNIFNCYKTSMCPKSTIKTSK